MLTVTSIDENTDDDEDEDELLHILTPNSSITVVTL